MIKFLNDPSELIKYYESSKTLEEQKN